MRLAMKCAHCRSRCTGQRTADITELTMEVYYLCTNPLCGHRFIACIEVKRTVGLSSMPNPSIRIPLSVCVERALIKAQLDYLPTAAGGEPSPLARTRDLFEAMPAPS